MATTLQLRRGTAAEAAALTGAQGELFIDVDNKLVYLHDGVTAGGIQVGGTGGGAAVVSGAVSGNTLTLTNSDATTVNVNVATLAQDANTFVSSATVNGSVITLHNNDGSTVNIQLPSSVTGFLPGEVMEDMVPGFDSVYDLGTSAERWYDAYLGNKLDINGAAVSGTSVLVPGETIITPTTTTENLSTTSIPSGATASNGYIMPWNAGAENEAKLLAIPVGTVVTIQGTTSNYFMGGGTGTIVANNGLVGPGPNGWYAVQLQWDQTVELISISSISWTQDTVTNVQTQLPDTYDYTLASNATLVAPSVAADTSLVGGLFTEGSTITPEHILGEYTDTKGTLTVDGNLIVADNLNVRNAIALKQLPMSIGTVTGFATTPESQTAVYLTDATAQAVGVRQIYFTQGSSTHTMYFMNAQQAAAFNEQFTVGLQVTFGLYVAGQGAFTMTVNIVNKTYGGSDSIDFSYNLVSGIEFNQFANWTHWYFPWYSSGQTYQMSSIGYTAVTPATYSVQFGGTVPVLGDVNKLFVNDVSSIEAPVTFTYINDWLVSLGQSTMMFNGFNFHSDPTYGAGFTISSMNDVSPLYDYFRDVNSMSFTSTMTGVTWELDILAVEISPAFGLWVKCNTISTSNPSYPTPLNVQSSYNGGQAGFGVIKSMDIKTYLTSAGASITAVNEYTTVGTDIRSKFIIGDDVSYTTKTTKLVFGDETSALSKAITYDESTGDITYDGLVTAVNLDSTTQALSSANAYPNYTFGNYSVTHGYHAKASGINSTAVGATSSASGNNSVAVGSYARAVSESSVSVGNGNANGSYATYVGRGGDGIGGMYHTTVLGMVGEGSSGWMWAAGQHVMTLGLANCYINQAGDYATVINGGGGSYVNGNLLGGSTWFAPQNRHAEFNLSVYQYKYSNGAATIYPQLGYTSSTSMPMDIPSSGSSSATSAIDTKMDPGLITQGKVTVTVQRRNSDDYGIYEIAFVARNNNAGTASIVQQTTTVVAQSGAATYWNNPVMYLFNDRYLQLSLTTTASSANNYITVHVGGDVRMNGAY